MSLDLIFLFFLLDMLGLSKFFSGNYIMQGQISPPPVICIANFNFS